MKLIIEIKDKLGYRIEKIDLPEQAVLTVGRAWSNDVVVTDPYVEANHLRIQVAGSISEEQYPSLTLSDAGTVNGTEFAKRSIVDDTVEYRYGESIKIGDSELKVYHQSLAVEPAALKSPWQHLQKYLTRSKVITVASLGVLLSVAFNIWAFNASKFQISNLVTSALGFAIFLLVWSLLLSGISKISKGKAGFRLHWSLSCIVSIVVSVLSILVGILVFNAQSHTFSMWAYWLAFGALGLIYTYIVLSNTSAFKSRTKWAVSAAMVGTVLVLFFVNQIYKTDRDRWTANTETETLSYPPSFVLRSPVTTEAFLEDSASLFEFNLNE